MEGKNYLFVIAIGRYTHYPPLNNAVRDAEAVFSVLTQLYQFDPRCVHTLFDEEATEDNIDEKFLELIDLIKEEDNLVVFYSGYGYYRKSVKEGYWIPSDGRQDKIADYITNANLIRYLQNIKAHHLLMMVDSCFSGALVEQLRGNETSEKFPSRRVFASGRTETVTDGLPGQNSPFAKGIIDTLKAHSARSVTSTELIRAVKEFVEERVGQKPVEGRLRDSKDNRGEFVFHRKLTESEFWEAMKAKNTLESYESYLSIYPEGRYSYEANIEFKECVASKAWGKAAKSDAILDYEDFLILHTYSQFAEQARGRIEQLKKTEGAERLMNATVKVHVPNKGGRGTPKPKESALTKKITIKRRPQLQQVGKDECRELLLRQANEYRRISMLDIWQDSIVSDIYIRDVVTYRINQYVFEETKAIQEGRGENIHEVAGWLLGRQHYDERQGKYLVSFERFIPIPPEISTTTKVIFGADGWQALEKARNIYNDESLKPVGWFHTHPGCGVFLSGQDINTHEIVFKEPYAIAMVLESVKAPYNVGVFSRRQEGNRLLLNHSAEAYHVWSDFLNWLKNG